MLNIANHIRNSKYICVSPAVCLHKIIKIEQSGVYRQDAGVSLSSQCSSTPLPPFYAAVVVINVLSVVIDARSFFSPRSIDVLSQPLVSHPDAEGTL